MGKTVSFAPTLDAMISEYDPVRLFDEILSGMDWTGIGSYARILCHQRLFQMDHHPRDPRDDKRSVQGNANSCTHSRHYLRDGWL